MKTSKLSGPVRALHLFLQDRMNGRYVLGTGSFDPRVAVKLDVDTFAMVTMLLKEAVDEGDWDEADAIVAFLPLYGDFLGNRRYDGHAAHLGNMVAAVAKRSASKTTLHLERLRKVVHRVAADRVFADNERVSIIRSEHGWHDGSISGTVKPGSGGHVVVDDDGHDIEIRHLRDIR